MNDYLNSIILQTPVVRICDSDNDIYIKRDDLLPFSFGGNKVRIALEFISDMYKQGMNCIVGYGNARSNLSRALANLCFSLKIPCFIISPSDDDGSRIETFNSKIVELCNAEIIYCGKDNVQSTVSNTLANLYDMGLKPYYIYGDSNGKGNEHIPVIAYRKVYEEIKGQYDYIFLATGTGMTQSGLLAGKSLCSGKEKIIGISIARDSKKETQIISSMLDAFSKHIESVSDEKIIVDDSYLCGGYGKYNAEIETEIKKQMVTNGIPLDPTYTGKAFWGMTGYLRKNDIKNKRILFIHTGGTPLFFDYENEIKLSYVSDLNRIFDAISTLEGNLIPSLSDRNIDINQYATKISQSGVALIHYNAGKPISMIAGYINDNKEYKAYISFVAVDKKYRDRKLGSALLSEFEAKAVAAGMKQIMLEVRKNNKVAQSFYRKHGFVFLKEASESSVYMLKNLEE